MSRLFVLLGLIVAGFAGAGWAWVGSSPDTIVARQAPWIVSAGLTGAGLLILGSALLAIEMRRRNQAVEILRLEQATVEARRIAGHAANLRSRAR